MDGAPRIFSRPDAFVAIAVEGLLKVTLTTQLPATAEAESTITTLSDDAMLQDETASEQTVAVQLWVPKMKLLPYSVTVLPAYAAAGSADATLGFALTDKVKLS
jgi:hypothetical protein